MKTIRRILTWSLIAIALQFSVYYYIDNFYLAAATSYQEVKVDNNNEINSSLDLPIPTGAEQVSVSYDGNYAAYYADNLLKVIDTQTGRTNKVELEMGATLSYYEWLPDRNRLIIAERFLAAGQSYLEFLSYDAQRGEKASINDNHNELLRIDLADNQAKVEDIALSTLTHTMYVKLVDSQQQNSIYSINVMNQLKKLSRINGIIGSISVVPHETRLIYEDLYRGKVVADQKGDIEIAGAEKPCLLSIDNDDIIYIGSMEDNLVRKIFYGKLEDPCQQWKSVQLKDPVSKENIHITGEGKIYMDDYVHNVLINVLSNQQTPYSGKFLQIYSNGLVSLDNGKLVRTILN